ncbi:hypothetical protein PQX77_010879 [Marasmius sp. AFHP31]|nr:hypothetical protein PQX77_010879 [Marasmius sp. AFHP31]
MPMRSTPYPRNVPPPTPLIRSTPSAPPNPGDPGDDPSHNTGVDEEDPFQPDQDGHQEGKEREGWHFEEPTDISAFLDEEELRREISLMAREAIQEQSRVSVSRSEVAEDRAKQEARKERIAAQSKIRMKDPDTFDGEVWENLKTFFEQCENTYEAKPDIYIKDNAKIQHATSWMTGKAKAAVSALQRRQRLGHRVPALKSWTAFKAEMRADFGLCDPHAYAQARIMKMKQEVGESYGDSYNRFSVMATRSGFDEASLWWHLLKSLSKPTLKHLRGSNSIPADYQALHRHLRDLDTNDHSMMEAELIDSYDVQVEPPTLHERPSLVPKTIPVEVEPPIPTPGSNFVLRSNNYQNRNNFGNNRTTTTTSEVRKAVTGLPGPSNAPALPAPPPPAVNPISWPSKEIRDQRRRDGLCLLCDGPDHFIPLCPHNQQIARGARSFAETNDTNTYWVEDEEGIGHLFHFDDVFEEVEESENLEETQEMNLET